MLCCVVQVDTMKREACIGVRHWNAGGNREGKRKGQACKLKRTEEGKCKADKQSRITCVISISKERKEGKERKEV